MCPAPEWRVHLPVPDVVGGRSDDELVDGLLERIHLDCCYDDGRVQRDDLDRRLSERRALRR